jgi:hypothetical protein
MSRPRKLAAVLAPLYVAGVIAAGAAWPVPSGPTIREDSPLFDCRMMGNRDCGFTPLHVLEAR